MALYHFTTKPLARSTRNTVCAVAYRAGCYLEDARTGESFNYTNKSVEHVELVLPKNAPLWAVRIQKAVAANRQEGIQTLCTFAEGAEKRMDARVWREFEFALHRELTDEQNIALARGFVEDQLCGRGMLAQLNFHFDLDKKTGEYKPHCHVLTLTRPLTESGLHVKKERGWNKRELLTELREQWAHYSNFHLKLHGHEVQIDHRSYHELGIEIEPQPKQGKRVLEQEKRTPHSTDKAQAFQETHLRNLYRILRHPETILDIVTKHHATFTWGDVQGVLHKYIEELPVFQRMEVRLKNSSHLVMLQTEKEGSPAIYTTKDTIKNELSLVKRAEKLAVSKRHDIPIHIIKDALKKATLHLTLSSEQKEAIRHLVNEQQISCVVGVAGSGKTTILGVCRDIWEPSGYKVYGLAPTGKAAQNLEQSGLRSTTIHRFLKEFESGRYHYNSRSVLVLDEAGMVDIKRFSKLLEAVERLGVKLVVMGDGAQLQPVEAGPAFRLITERVGSGKLTTVVRQKEEWQKEATVLFGKQRTKEALSRYEENGKVHIIKEALPPLSRLIAIKDYQGVVRLYEIARRSASLIYREMRKDLEGSSRGYQAIQDHLDFERYKAWRNLEKDSATAILTEGKSFQSFLEARSLDPTRIGRSIVDKNFSQALQQEEIKTLLQNSGFKAFSYQPNIAPIDVRQETKRALLKAWHTAFKDNPGKSSLMLTFSNQDVSDLNNHARFLLKTSNHIEKKEFLYTTKRQIENDFGKKRLVVEEKAFSKGDRIVFTRNNYGLGVKNGTLGTVLELDQQKIHVRLEDEKEVSFAPKLNPFFDHGWAITIHKSQGTTVDKAYVLASAKMNKNLTYVAMTRHREDVQIFGSSLDFWRPEKLPDMLAKSGEKLSAGDYLNVSTLQEHLEKREHLLTKIFHLLSDELQALGIVSKKAFERIVETFLGSSKREDVKIPVIPLHLSLREEVRAEKMLQKKHNVKPFHEVVKLCENRLHTIIQKEGKPLTSEQQQRIPLQAEKTANFLFYSHYTKGSEPSEKEISQASLRAKYELARIPQIRNTILRIWYDKNKAETSRGNQIILAHMLAERLASIEGRLYLEAKREGIPPPSNLPKLAQKEFQEHKRQIPQLAEELSQKYALPKNTATSCAKHMFRYKETHGTFPPEHQLEKIVRIARELGNKTYKHPSRELGQHEVEFLRMREEDLLLKGLSGRPLDVIAALNVSTSLQEREQHSVASKALWSQSISQNEHLKTHGLSSKHQEGKDRDYGPSL